MWIAHFNQHKADSHFERPLGARVYADEKVACIIITQSIKCFLEEKILEVFCWMKRKRLFHIFLRP